MKLTQIQVGEDTKKELKKLKQTNRESYNEIIKRLLENEMC